jgi:hypothetical protein
MKGYTGQGTRTPGSVEPLCPTSINGKASRRWTFHAHVAGSTWSRGCQPRVLCGRRQATQTSQNSPDTPKQLILPHRPSVTDASSDRTNIDAGNVGQRGSSMHTQPPQLALTKTPPTQSDSRDASSVSRRNLLHAVAATTAAATLGPLVLTSPSSAATLAGRPPPEMGFEPRVVEFTLSNGLHFIVLPRSNAPVVACHTYANGEHTPRHDGLGRPGGLVRYRTLRYRTHRRTQP